MGRSISGGFALLLVITIVFFSACRSGRVPLPSDSKKIALPALSQGIDGAWNLLGFRSGQRAPDFTLFSQSGKPFHLYDELKHGKPIVFVNGSYTCDISRGKLPGFRSIYDRYKDKVTFMMVYTIDAHPSDSPSPYSADHKVWIPKNNIRDHVKASQPVTYGERVKLSKVWKQENGIPADVLVDSPDNEFWQQFGQAPNMAYVIEPNDTIYYKQTWFNESDLDKNIKTLLAE